MPESRQDFYIGEWLIQPAQLRVRGPGKTVRVEPKVMDVLVCLADFSGETVSRERLLETVWAGTIVTDDVLTRSISTLRKVFEDDPRNPKVIETIPKIGYRLILPHRIERRGDQLPTVTPSLDVSAIELPRKQEKENSSKLQPAMILAAGLVVLLLAAFWWWHSTSTEPVYHPVPLTTYPGQERSPVLSPDGRQVAFSWAGEEDNLDIYVRLVGVESMLRLTDDPTRELSPAWSPDGARVAYIRREVEGCAIYTTPALGGEAQRVASCNANIYADLSWSPDGQWLAFSDRETNDEPFSVTLVSPETGERRSITSPPSPVWGDHDPRFSPDGSFVSFTRSVSEGMQDLYIVPVDGGEARRITNDSRNINGSAWTSDSRSLVYSSNRTGRSGLWQISAEGGPPSWLGIGDAQAYFPSIVGNRLVYLQSAGLTNIWMYDLEQPKNTTPVIASTRWDMHPQWSPDGRRIAFTSNRSGSYEIWLSDSTGTSPRRITDFGGPFTSTPRWSPNGNRLVFTSRPGGQADLYTMGVDDATPRRLTEDPTDEMAASWSSDGQSIYFSSNRSGSWEVWKMAVGGGPAEQITDNGGFGPQEAGGYICYAKHNARGLWRKPVAGGNEEQVLAGMSPRDWGSWAILGDRAIYINREGQDFIASFNVSTSQLDTLFVPEHGLPSMDPALTVSSDGRRILFGQSERSESDIMLVEGL